MAGIDKWQEKDNAWVADLKNNPRDIFAKFFQSYETRKNLLKKENIEELAAGRIYYTDWLVMIGRWGVIAFLALYGIIIWGFSSVYLDPSDSLHPAWRYFSLLVLWGILNAFYHKTGGPKSRNTALGRIGCDILLLLFFVHYTGGGQSFCFALFLLVSIEAALQLRGALLPLSVAAVSTILFGFLLALEAVGILTHFSVFPSHSALLAFFLFSGLLNFASVLVVTHLVAENRVSSERLQAGVNMDMSTGIYTRDVLFSQLESEIERCSRSHQALSIILAGIDNMEEYNRKFGYRAGDKLLAEVGDIINKNIRNNLREEVGARDIVCRYSGDIFAIILPEAKPAYDMEEMRKLKEQMHSGGVLLVAKRLQRQIAEIPGVHSPVRISIGGAHWPYHGNSADELVRESFRALTEAKSQGKNRIVLATKGVKT